MRLIDADKLRDAMFHYYGCVNADTDKSNYKGETLMNYEVADLIDDCISTAPTVEAEPVRHGHWNYKFTINGQSYRYCSECLEIIYDDTVSKNYCPYCGARMEGNE